MILTSFMDPTWSAPPNSDYVATAPQFLVNEEAHQHPPANSLSPGSPGDLSWLAPDMMGVHDVKAVRNEIVPQDDMGFATSGQSLSIMDEWAWDSSSNGNGFPSQDGGAEDALFMHYLNRVFYIQYPFYLSRNPRGRGCLFSILRMVKPAYLATLALSERDLLSSHPQQDDVLASLTQLRSKGGYYNLAAQGTQRLLQESHTWNRSAHMVHNIESLASILQLLFWELFAGGRGNWQVLLREAARLIPGLLEAPTPLTKPKPAGSVYTNPPHHIETLSPDDHCATGVLLGSFISLDIIASASTRRPPFLNIDHAQALRNPCISLESIMGCSNSVMALIFEISSLDRWKEESQAVRKLSIIDLAERGRQIEERLRQELKDMDTGPSFLNRSGVLSAPANPDVNRLFALSALIYLHVVISGAHPELPEIADAVSQVIAVFKGLWDPRLLQSVLVWPFCVSGCLALGEQQNFFRDLFSAAEITESTVELQYRLFSAVYFSFPPQFVKVLTLTMTSNNLDSHQPLISALTTFYTLLVDLCYVHPSWLIVPSAETGRHPPNSINEVAARRNGFNDSTINLAYRIPYVTDEDVHLHAETRLLCYLTRVKGEIQALETDEERDEDLADEWEFARDRHIRDAMICG
ncbi:hypothetical protein CNMCM5793_003558 [Aspergillus hiratsukae]|uniref:Transcription factor domain-containing protein n=1 Tax=Aspergillus hiratsukae TaxID=1194566 RepID=A0A8H6UYL8_9EURO|nr:hypothetical protein CNMCM5793_003558 [Aspergillus hiratsukae]KAF7167510.1 hypothetical protein CNMCM6106_003042 [Aspergillus hiratsukae]